MTGSAQKDELNQSLELINRVSYLMGPIVRRMTPLRRQVLIEAPDVLGGMLEDCFFPTAPTANGLKRFDPVSFIGKGWQRREQDSRLAGIGIPDPAKLSLVTHLKKNEECTTGDERRKRLAKAKDVPLGTDLFLYYWEHKDQIPESWKEKTNGKTTFIFFDGEELFGPHGHRYALYLCWFDGGWSWDCLWLGVDRLANDPSVVVASELVT